MEDYSPPLTSLEGLDFNMLCSRIRKTYGVKDAEKWYHDTQRRIHARCLPDRFGMLQHDSLADYYQAKQLELKWKKELRAMELTDKDLYIEPPLSGARYTVELYQIRAPGANGEIGVLTTASDISQFITGLSCAMAKHFDPEGKKDMEHSLNWVLKNALPLAFRLAGYKADQVVERHVLMCGSSAPAKDDIIAAA